MGAAAGAQLYPNLRAAPKSMPSIAGSYRPDRSRHDAYAFYMQQYRQTYYRLKDQMRDTNQHLERRHRQPNTAPSPIAAGLDGGIGKRAQLCPILPVDEE